MQKPKAPEKLEQWVNQMEIISSPLLQGEVNIWNPAWKAVACGSDMSPGWKPKALKRENVLVIHPVDESKPAVLTAQMVVPGTRKPMMSIGIASDERGNFVLKVFVNDNLARESLIDTKGEWITETVDLTAFSGQRVKVRLENHANDWHYEAAYLHRIDIR